MNNYFNNLAIRTVSGGNLVQPRIASVFEPQGAAIESRVETAAPGFAAAYTDQGDAVSAAPVRNPLSDSATQPFDRHSPVEVVARTEESVFEPTLPQAEAALRVFEARPNNEPEAQITGPAPAKTRSVTHNAPEPARDLLVREHATVEVPEIVKEATAAATPLTTPQTTPPRTTTTSRRIVAHQHVSGAATSAPLDPTKPDAQVEESAYLPQPEPSGRLSVKSVVREPTTPTPRFSERLVKQTHVRREQHTRTRRDQLLLEAPLDAEPSINVTIGRVEVRATPAPAAKQNPTRKSSPVMPLEEYLRKQRRGDER